MQFKGILRNILLSVAALTGFFVAESQTYNHSATTVNTCSGTYRDNGGTGNYSNNQNAAMTFCSNSTTCVRVVFSSFNLEDGFDFLKIYDGTSTTGLLLGTYTGTNSPGTITSTTGCLTFEFESDATITNSGWQAAISCPACPGSCLPVITNGCTSFACKSKFYDSGGTAGDYQKDENIVETICSTTGKCLQVKFNSFNTDNGSDFLFIYNGPTIAAVPMVTLTGANNPGTIKGSNPCMTFRFTSNNSQQSTGWDADISCVDCQSCLPNMGTCFDTAVCSGNFYDPGGPTGNYSNFTHNIHTICAPAGQCLDVDFTSFVLQNGPDSLIIYDGPSIAAPVLSKHTGTNSPGLVESSTGCLTFEFYTNNSFTFAGWAATINCKSCKFVCSEKISNCSDSTCNAGFYDSGGKSLNYSNNENFIRTVCADSGQCLLIDFNAFDIENGFDFLTIYDGDAVSDPIIGVFTGTTSPDSVYATSGCLTLEFNSDASFTGAGWEADITCAACPACLPNISTCTATSCGSMFYDNGGPGSNYLNNTNVVQTICGANGKCVRIDFTSFELTGVNDFLNIHDGPNTLGTFLGQFKEKNNPGTVIGSSGCLTFAFSTGAANNAPGWEAAVTCISCNFCPSYMTTCYDSVCTGKFYDSGGSSSKYGNNESKIRTICSDNGQCARVEFNSFELEQGFDFLKIYDGPGINSTLTGIFTGTNSPGIVTGSSGCLTFEFSSDGSFNFAGWDADITCTSCQSCLPKMSNCTDTVCGGKFYDPSGNFQNYQNNLNLVHTLCGPPGQCFEVDFTQFSLDTLDTLYVYDGPSVSGNPLAKYTGLQNPGNILSNSGCLTFKFISNGSVTGTGWEANVNCNQCPPCLPAIGTCYDQVCSGAFYDSGTYTSDYGPGESKIHTVCANTNQCLQVVFNSFALGNGDSLMIHDGTSILDPTVGVFKNSFSPGTVIAESGCLTFHFASDIDTASLDSGWTAAFSCVACPKCPEKMTSCIDTVCSVNFFDPGGDAINYQNNQNIFRTYCSDNNNCLQVEFSSFDLEFGWDYLIAYDGFTSNDPVIGTFTGTNSPGKIFSTGTCLTFEFFSDASNTAPGWDAFVSCTACPSCLPMMNNCTDSTCYGDFYDAGGKNQPYPNGDTLIQTICSPYGNCIAIDFTSFGIDTGDELSVFAGSDTSGVLIGTFTGTMIPGKIISDSSCLTFYFTSNATVNGPGWQASFACQTCYDCPFEMTTCTDSICTGTFYDSGGEPAGYAAGEYLVRTYCSDAGSCVSLEFDTLDLENGFDFLKVFEGPDTNGVLLGKFTGQMNPGTISSSSGCLTFLFESDATLNGSGWEAGISCAPCPVCLPKMGNCSDTTCGGKFYDDGNIYSNYENNKTLIHKICSSDTNCLEVSFTSFSVHVSDTLYAFEGMGTTGPVIGAWTGTVGPGKVFGGTPCMTFKFVSDASLNSSGWTADVDCRNCTKCPPPMETCADTTCDGAFYDSGGASAVYANSDTLVRTICGEAGKCVKVSFSSFDLENGFDYLRIYDGADQSGTFLGAFTGTASPGTVISTSGCLTFVFISDQSTANAGWNASISCQACPGGCLPKMATCTDTICNGDFYDPGGFASGYGNSQDFTTSICSPFGKCLSLIFDSFDVKPGDTLKVYNGPGTGSPPIGSYSGTIVPDTFETVNGCLTFRFISNSTLTGAGWHASIACNNCAGCIPLIGFCVDTVCDSKFFDSDSAGNYNNNEYKVHTVCAPVGQCTQVDFSMIKIGTGDTLKVYEGNSLNGPLLAKLTGNSGVKVFSSALGCLTFEFKSNATVTDSGWKATVTCVPCPACPSKMTNCIDSLCNGKFYDSGGLTQNYTANENLIKTICGAAGECVKVNFTAFNIENNFDFLKIFDGDNVNASLLGNYSGTTSPGNLVSASGCITFEFISDGSTQSAGWSADVSCSPCAGCLPEISTCTDSICNSNFYDSGGKLNNYKNNELFTHTVCSPTGKCLNIDFSSFSLGGGDTLWIYNGSSISAPSLGIFTSAISPVSLTSTAGCLTFRFKSDFAGNAAGWQAYFSCVDCGPCLPLMGYCTDSTCSGQFYDPAGPNGNYAANQYKVHTICSDKGNCIAVEFLSFNLGTGDYLKVYDGPNTSFALDGTYTGTTSPVLVNGSGPCVTFEFKSDGAGSAPGWSSIISCGSCGACPEKMTSCTDTLCSGKFFDPGGNGNYGSYENVIRIICAPSGSCPVVKFNSFSLEPIHDNLVIYNGPTFFSPVVGAYNGSNNPGTVTGTNGCILFHFQTNGPTSFPGWNADISCIPCAPTCLPNITSGCLDTTCTGKYYDTGGSGGNYKNNENMVQTICGDNSQCLKIDFTSFLTETLYDWLYIYDGPDTTYPMVGSGYTGNLSPGAVKSTYGCLTFQWISDNSAVYAGWEADFSCVACETCLPELENCTDTVCDELFYDPGGLLYNYKNSENIVHTVCSDSGSCIEVNFEQFMVHATDKLMIFDGPSVNYPLIGTFNNSNPVDTITSHTGCLTFQFISDTLVVDDGWEGAFSCVPCPPCLPVMNQCVVNACVGNFYDPGGKNNNYQNNQTLEHVICPDTGSCTRLVFTSFDLGSGDSLWIFDGTSSLSGILIGAYGGTASPGIVVSKSGCMTFLFESNGSGTGTGWVAKVLCGECSCLPNMITCTDQLCNGNFFDHGGDTSDYGNNEDFIYTFCPDSTYDICGRVIFDSFVLAAGDTLFVYNGSDTNALLIGTYTIGNSPDTVTSFFACLTFRFVSDDTITAAGWKSKISCLPCPPCLPVMTNCTDSICAGFFQDPGGGSNYFNDQHFVHTICSDDGNCSRVFFNSFSINSSDLLLVYDGSDTNSTFIGSFTGNDSIGELFSLSGCLTFEFISDDSLTAAGWEALVYCMPCACLPVINNCTDSICGSAFFDDGGSGQNYSASDSLVHIVCSDSGNCVRVDFSLFDIDESDTLYIWDGNDVFSTLIGKYNGNAAPFNVFSLTGCLKFVFVSDSAIQDTGWTGNLFCAPCNCLPVMNNCSDATCEGDFADPGGSSGNYFVNDTIIHTICSDAGNCVNVTFNSFSIHSSDTLFIYDGAAPGPANLKGKYTGTMTPGFINSTSGCLTFVFISDNAGTGTGWTADVGCGPCTCLPYMASCKDTSCNTQFWDTGGDLYNYSNSDSITHVVCPDAGKCTQAIFTNFKVHGSDTLLVFIGTSTEGPLLGSFTAGNVPDTLTSMNGCLTFVFISDGAITDSGWIAEIKCVKCPLCVPVIANCLDSTCDADFWDTGNGAADYSTDEFFLHTICSDSGNCTRLTFNSFALGLGDTMWIYDGTNDLAPLIDFFTGNVNPGQVFSLSGCLTIKFISDSANTAAGWDADLSCAECSCLPVINNCNDLSCNNTFTDSGTDTSDYGDDQVFLHSVCADIPGNCVRVEFSEFLLDSTDTLIIWDGVPGFSPALLGKFTGSTDPFNIFSLSGCLTFEFKSDSAVTDSGWMASIYCAPCVCLPLMNDCQDSICTGSYTDAAGSSGNYYDNDTLIHTICSDSGNCATVTFSSFDIATGDFLYVYQGSDTTGQLLGIFSGTSLPPVLISSTGCLTFLFISDSAVNAPGWQSAISCAPCTCVPYMTNGCTDSICNSLFYDTGGSLQSYGNNENVTHTVCSSLGNCISVDFSSFDLSTGDFLRIHDGPNSTYPRLAVMSGTNGKTIIESSSGCLTFVMQSNGILVDSGWIANINCVPCPPCGPSMTTCTDSTCSAVFMDPGGAGNYSVHDRRIKTFCSDSAGMCLKTLFSLFKMGIKDSLYAYNGSTIAAPLIGKFHAGNMADTIESTGECITFMFISDSVGVDSGWAAGIWCVPCNNCVPIITNNCTDSVCSGNFYDTGGLAANYNNNTLLTHTICSPYAGSCLQINFTQFKTQVNVDKLKVFDGPDVNSPQIGNYSGTVSPFTVKSSTGCLTFQFNSSVFTNDIGWASNFTCVPCQNSSPCLPSMGNCLDSTCSSVFTDPGGPTANYPNNTFKIHTVCATGGKCASVTFSSFSLENQFDYMEVFDGTDINSPWLGKWSGTNSPGTLNSISGCLTFKFLADNSNTAAGWVSQLKCVNCPLPCGNINAAFAWADNGLNVIFTETGYEVPPATYDWSFGDGFTSTLKNPVHGYSTPGTYYTCLVVNDSCFESDTICDSVTVSCPGSVIDFGIDSSSYITAWLKDSTIGFGTIQAWLWEFGDGTTDTAQNPVHYFPHDGPWNICLWITDSCTTDSACKTIQLNCPSAVAEFSYTDTLVTFWFSDSSTSTQGGIDSLLWDFGDGNSDTAKNPIHIFPGGGFFLVCLSVWDSCGIDSICKNVFVDCPPPFIDFSYDDTLLTVEFTDSFSGTGTVSWIWKFGDGNTTTSSDPVHDYNTSGTYAACLVVTDSCATDSLCDSITVLCPPPLTGFTDTTSFLNAFFTDTSSGIGSLNWLWNFGDGSSSNTQNPVHVYPSAGTYFACLIVTDSCQADTTCDSVQINCADPVPEFQFSVNVLQATFNNTSTGNGGFTWLWNFGDATTSAVQHPVHSFTNPGTYNVCLTATDTCNSVQVCSLVTVTCPGLGAYFGWDDTLLTVQFSDSSTGAVSNWLWQFGDGNTANTQNPVHNYSASGTYTVCLLATDTCGTDSTCKQVSVLCPKPDPDFSWNSTLLTAFFSDSSSGIGTLSWLWDFGDGGSSNQQDPVHFYNAGGPYTVCLTATDSCDSDSSCQVVNIICNPPVASYTNMNTLWTVKFTTTSSVFPPATYQWDFGDGATSVVPSPTHTYSANGNYTVCMQVTDTCGSDTVCKTIQVLCPKPVANFTFANSLMTAVFTNTSTGTGTKTYLWNFGDGTTSALKNPSKTWTSEGFYTVCLLVTDTCSIANVCKTVGAFCPKPAVEFAYSTSLFTATFSDSTPVIGSSSFFWTFGDGNISVQKNPVYTYTASGTYKVCLNVTDTCGSDSTCHMVTITCPLPFFDYAYNDTILTVTFLTLIQANGTENYFWTFGDGFTSTLKTPVHTYAQAGNYTACLTVTDTCGSDSVCHVMNVTCPVPEAEFTWVDTLLTAMFQDSSATIGNVTRLWNFGDGATSFALNPVHNYTMSGTYNVCLNVIDSCDFDSTCHLVTVLCPAPAIAFTDSAENNNSYFNSSIAATGSYSLIWDFGDGDTSISANPVHTFPGPGIYQVCLSVTDSCQFDSVCKQINIACPLPTVGFTWIDTLLQVSFTDTSGGLGSLFWLWDFGDGSTDSNGNPVHVFAASGTYQVCLTVTDTCVSDSICKQVSVVCPVPDAAFATSINNVTVTFSDSSTGTGSLAWAWNFGDGNSSSLQNPIHTYTFIGTYSACLVAADTCSSDTICDTFAVSCPGLGASFSFSTTNLIAGFTNASSGGGAMSWFWQFGDGQSSMLQDPIHGYAIAGSYQVCLTATDTCGSDSVCNTVTVSCPGLNSEFIWDDTLLTVNFADSSTGTGITSRLWTFGDGDSSTALNPVHDYSNSGTYTVCLKVTNYCGPDTTCHSVVVLCPKPSVSFNTSDSILTANFTNSTSGTGTTSWFWTFGDGDSSTAKNPVHDYPNSGTYQVCLTATDSCGFDSACSMVTVLCPVPVATFSSSSSQLNITFTNTTSATGAMNSLWDFGDGNVSTQQNPVHVYSAPGTYLVCLTAIDSCGQDSACNWLVVSCPSPDVGFTYTNTMLTVNFTDTTNVQGTATYAWIFGDGNISLLQNPLHDYPNGGSFLVCLTVTDVCGTDSTCKPVYINCPMPNVNFTFTDSLTYYDFSDGSSGTGTLSRLWTFGDGTSSILTNPSHLFPQNGKYSVCLVVSDTCGTDSTCKIITINCPKPIADFNSTTNLLTATFANISTVNTPISWLWDFGDGGSSNSQNPVYNYPAGGTYTACLIADDLCKSDTICKTVTLNCPVPVASYAYADSLIYVNFVNTSSTSGTVIHTWDFGDGTTSNLQNPFHVFPSGGAFTVCLEVNDLCGYDSVCTTVTVTCPQPGAAFTHSTSLLNVAFTELSTGISANTWNWDFGDGNSSNLQNPSNFYMANGTYNVCLIATGTCGIDTVCDSVQVYCPVPVVGFSSIANNLTLIFSDTTNSNIPVSWLWDFGDGGFSTDSSITHIYLNSGTYTVCLSLADLCGSDSACKAIVVSCPPPDANFTVSDSLLFVDFTDASTTFNGTGNCQWDFGDGNTSNLKNPSHTYNAAGFYTVCMKVTDACGEDSICKFITINCPDPIASWSSLSNNLLANFTNLSNSLPPVSYLWSFGDGFSSTSPGPSHLYAQSGTYQVCLTINDLCKTDSSCKNIIIACPPLVPAFSITSNLLTITFADSTTGFGNMSWQWSFGDGSNSFVTNPVYTYPYSDTFTVCLTVTDSCNTDSVCKQVIAVCTLPLAKFGFFSNATTSNFSDSSITVSTSPAWQWDFGDGALSPLQNPSHTYPSPGTYFVCLVVADTCGNDTTCDSVSVTCPTPVSGFNSNINFLIVNFSDTSSGTGNLAWLWTFGDGGTSASQNPSHSYGTTGTYNVCLIVTDACGKDTVCTSISVQCPPPSAKFGYSANLLQVTFTDSSSGAAITQWQWDFGDGNGSLALNPVYTYAASGTYFVCLTVSDSCGDSTWCDSVNVTDVGAGGGIPDDEILVFPNPTDGDLYIKFRLRNSYEASVSIRNILGQMVRRQELGSVEYSVVKVDISDIAGGIYHLEIEIDGKTVIRKIDLMR